MDPTLHETCISLCDRTLERLDHILARAAGHAEAHDIDPAVLLDSRLFPDMFPLMRQVQIATDVARRGVARLAGEEPASVEDDERSFDDLRARIADARQQMRSFPDQKFDGAGERTITLELRSGQMSFKGRDFVLRFVIPNVYFHVTTAYAILRHNGVPLGKADFLGDM